MPTLAGALRPLASHATSSASASCCYRTLRRLAGRAATTTIPNRGGRFPAVAALMTVANHHAARRDAAPSTPPSAASSSCGWRHGHHRARTTHVTHVSSLSDPLPDDVPSWTEAADSPAPSSRFAVRPASRIFCNRSLNMNAIAAGRISDMDYTLAMYRPETFEVLAYTQTCRKLVDVYGYPPKFWSWSTTTRTWFAGWWWTRSAETC